MSDIPYSVRGGRTSTSVAGLTDTTITNLQNQQILKYDSASQKWVNAVDGGGGATISSLGDTLISNPQTNQSLVYNATVSPARWENQVTPFTQSDFTNAVSTDAAFIKHKPIISTTSSSTMVGMNTGVNKEGDLTAFGKGAGNTAANNHICIGAFSGNLGNTAAISIGYNTHATHAGSVVIHGKDLEGLSSSAVDAFYIDPLRTINALTETAGNMKINMYNTSTKEIFLTDNLLVPGKTKLNGTLEVSNGIGSVNQVLTSNNTGALTWTDKSQLSSNIYDLGGLTWSGVSDNELIRRTSSTTADGTGMTITDINNLTDNKKTVSFFNRLSPLNVPLGLIDYSFNISSTVYKTHLSPKSSHATTSNGLFLQATSTVDAVKVGINVSSPSQDFQVGTTLYVDDTNKKVGINVASPNVDLEVLNTMYVDSNTRKVGIVNATPTTTFQVGTTLYVDETTGKVGIKTATPATELEVVGEARISNNGTQVLSFYDTAHNHEHGTIEGHQSGQGGRMEFHVKNTGSNALTSRLNINPTGSISFANSNDYGSSGQVLTSNGDAPPSWTAPTAGPATILTGSGFDVTVGTYPSNTNLPQLKADGNNNVHVFYADKTGALNGAGFDITVGQYPGYPTIPQLKVGTSNNVHVFYADIAGEAYLLRGYKQITSVNLYGGTSVSLFGNGANNVHVFYADIAGRLSDDRIKWNETPINTDRTIEIVKRLKFYQYDILKEPRLGSLDPEEPYDPSKCKVGFGVIAQEIEELGNEYPELKDTPFQLDEIKGVGYDNIFALLGATTQMLISRIETLENEVKQLKAK